MKYSPTQHSSPLATYLGGEAHYLAAVGATKQGQEAGMLEQVGVRQVRLTPSVVLAALEGLGQG